MKKYKYSQYISLGYDSEGNRIRKWIYANNKNELALKKAQLQEQFRNCSLPLDISFGKYSDKWLNTFKSAKEAATRQMYEQILHYADVFYAVPLRNLKVIDLQELINEHYEHPRTCQQIALCLKQIWKSAIKDGIVQQNIAESLELPKYKPVKGRALKPEEKTALKSCNLEPMDRMYIYALYYLGLRPAEALALMPCDFDFSACTVNICRAVGYDANNPYIKPTKTSVVRQIPLPSEYAVMLKPYLQDLNSLYLFHRGGKLMSKTVKSDMWLRIRKEINAQLGGTDKLDLTDGLRPYTFRHNFCCVCYYAGLTPLMTSRLMGNSPAMVMGVYAHLDESKEDLNFLLRLTM